LNVFVFITSGGIALSILFQIITSFICHQRVRQPDVPKHLLNFQTSMKPS